MGTAREGTVQRARRPSAREPIEHAQARHVIVPCQGCSITCPERVRRARVIIYLLEATRPQPDLSVIDRREP